MSTKLDFSCSYVVLVKSIAYKTTLTYSNNSGYMGDTISNLFFLWKITNEWSGGTLMQGPCTLVQQVEKSQI